MSDQNEVCYSSRMYYTGKDEYTSPNAQTSYATFDLVTEDSGKIRSVKLKVTTLAVVNKYCNEVRYHE